MDPIAPYRPRVSRETRLLVSAAFLAVVALWILSRLTLPEPSRPPSGVAPILAPLVPRPAFDELAQSTADATLRASGHAFAFPTAPGGEPSPAGSDAVTAIRFRDDLAVTLPPDGLAIPSDGVRVMGRDALTGLVVVAAGMSTTPVPTSIVRQPERPRYLMRADGLGSGIALVPVFVGALSPVDLPTWAATGWLLPPGNGILRGDLLFSVAGDWVGLAVDDRERLSVVPAAAVVRMAERILSRAPGTPVTLGIDLQSLTPGLRTWAGVNAGAAVTWVDQEGPLAEKLDVGDVLVAANGRALTTAEHWRRYLADLDARDAVTLRVQRAGRLIDVRVTGRPVGTQGVSERVLGLGLASAGADGARVVTVQQPSLAASARLQPGDVITMIGGVYAPSPAQVRQTVRTAPAGRPLIVAVRRGTAHHLVTIQP